MKIVVFGADGQLGTDLTATIKRAGQQCFPLTLEDADITDSPRVEALLKEAKPDVVVNCAALHDVAKCEENHPLADAVNRDAVGELARISAALGAKFLTISSDYVFDGTKIEGYTEDDEPNPINYYGVSKLAGERLALANNSRAFVLRVQSLYGIAGPKGKGINFVDLVLKLSKERDELKIDQCRMAPTGTAPLAENILKLIASECFGLFHMSCQGATTWYEFARKIVEIVGAKVKVTPVANDFFPKNFRRPENTYLINKRLGEVGLDIMPSWEDSVRQYLLLKGIAIQK
jgi:dTDP-4-dehydrorhamnose reductase